MSRMIACITVVVLTADIAPAVQECETDLLMVGATESGWAAAIQAARNGVKSITIVHDGEWIGGQYTEQALACVDENKGMDTLAFPGKDSSDADGDGIADRDDALLFTPNSPIVFTIEKQHPPNTIGQTQPDRDLQRRDHIDKPGGGLDDHGSQ